MRKIVILTVMALFLVACVGQAYVGQKRANQYVTCVFQNSQKEESCHLTREKLDLLGCKGVGKCTFEVKENYDLLSVPNIPYGTYSALKGSCGDAPGIRLDHDSDTVTFTCAAVPTAVTAQKVMSECDTLKAENAKLNNQIEQANVEIAGLNAQLNVLNKKTSITGG